MMIVFNYLFIIILYAYLFSKDEREKDVDEDLGGVWRRKTVIRIYCMKKSLFSLKM